MIAGAGMQFESHLGRSVSAGQGPFGVSGCAQIFFCGFLRGRCGAGWLHSLGSATLGWLLLHGLSGAGRHDLLGCVVRSISCPFVCCLLPGCHDVVPGLLLDHA